MIDGVEYWNIQKARLLIESRFIIFFNINYIPLYKS